MAFKIVKQIVMLEVETNNYYDLPEHWDWSDLVGAEVRVLGANTAVETDAE